MSVGLIICAIGILLLLLPIGVDITCSADGLLVKAKIWIFKLRVFPRRKKKLSPEAQAKKTAKKELKKAKIAEKKAAKSQEATENGEEPEGKKKPKLALNDIIEIAGLAVNIISKFKRSITIDILHLSILVRSDDPYSCVTRYGYINAALGMLLPLLHRAFKVRNEKIKTDFLLENGGMEISARSAASVQVWEILFIVICALCGAIKWYIAHRKKLKRNLKQEACVS